MGPDFDNYPEWIPSFKEKAVKDHLFSRWRPLGSLSWAIAPKTHRWLLLLCCGSLREPALEIVYCRKYDIPLFGYRLCWILGIGLNIWACSGIPYIYSQDESYLLQMGSWRDKIIITTINLTYTVPVRVMQGWSMMIVLLIQTTSDFSHHQKIILSLWLNDMDTIFLPSSNLYIPGY